MFRAKILPNFRTFRLCNKCTACGMLYAIFCRSVIWWRRNSVTRSPTGNILGTTYHKLYMYCTVLSSWRWAKLLPETCPAKLDLSINRYCCVQLAFFLASLLMMHDQTNTKKATVNFVMSVRPSVWNNSVSTKQIFKTLDIQVF